MKKIVLFAAMMLIGAIQSMNAQNEAGYSLESIGKTLSRLNITSLGDFHEGLAWVRVGSGEDERYGFVDTKGNLISPRYARVKDFSDGFACVGDGNWKFGFIDKQGNTVIPFSYGEYTGSFSDGLALINFHGNSKSYAYINKNGEIVIPQFDAYQAKSFNGGIAPIEETKRNTHFIDKKGNIVIQSQPYRCYGFKDGFYMMDNFVIDTIGNVVVPAKYNNISALSEGLCGVEISKENRTSGYSVSFLWGFYDINKKCESIQPKYDAVSPFSEGFAAVQIGKKWGYINKQGETVIACSFKHAYDFHEGFAFVNTDESYAIIDKQGNIVTHLPNYDYFRGDFSEGLAVINQNGKWGYVDIHGNSTFNPKANTKNNE